MFTVKSWDPGKATGWAEFTVDDGKITEYECGEGDLFEIGDRLNSPQPGGDLVFIFEKYTMNAKISQSPWSLEVIGVVKYWAEHHGAPTVQVAPSSHKTLVGSDGVRRAKLWTPGKPHANDACSVGLWYLATKRNMSDFLRTS